MRSLKLIAFGALGVLGGVLPGCGARQLGTTPPIVELRRQAEAHPDDPAILRQLAIGEMLWEDGDPDRATVALSRWRARSPNAEAALLAGADHYFHGEPGAALEAFLVALESEPSALIAEEAAAGVEEVIALAPNAFESASRLEAVLPNLPLGARQTVVDVLSSFAYRQGQPGRLPELREAAHCLGQWQVAGPFGPRTQLGFDQTHPADAPGALEASYDLGIGRGERPTRTVHARGCSVLLGEGPVADGGTTYAETFVQTEAGVHTLRLETPNSVEVKIDGEVVVHIDHRRQPLRRVTFHRLELGAGRHEITVKITSRHPNPVMVASLMPGDHRVDVPEDASPLSCYLRAGLLMSRGQVIDARESLDACPVSPQILSYRAAVALRDPFVTDDMRRDGSRQLLVELAARDERAWIPVIQLARLKAAEGRDQEAIADLRGALGRWPELSSIPLALADMLLSRGWDAEARGYIAQALEVAPGTCAPIEAALAEAQRRDRIAEIDRYTEALMECDARGGERYAQLLAARRWEDARRELQRLEGLEPAHRRLRFTGNYLDLAAAQGQSRRPLLERYAEAHPRSDSTRLALADQRLAAGDRAGALALLDEAMAQEPAAMLSLQRIRAALGGTDEFSDYRIDGLAALREFEASGRGYEEPQVLVLDYTVHRVFEDASSLALTHQIYKLQSEEAVDAQGEFGVPEDAYMLTLRTIKADGTVLEPDLIAGKETISLPHLAVGDSIEYEYVRVLGPASGLPGGLLGDRFFFASYEIPFDRTELVVVAPEAMDIVVDPRGDAPQLRRSNRNGLQELRWRADEVASLVAEPASISTREFIPSINWGVEATWEGLLEGLRDVLVDREVIDPVALRLARQLTEGAGTDRDKAQRIFAWVLEHIENTDAVFGAAAPMLAGRTGNRARIIHYLLGLIDVPSSLVLARNFGGDQTIGTIADETTYSTLMVRVGEGEEADFLVSASRGIPYGYVPQAFRGQEALVLSPFENSAEVRRIQISDGTTPDTRTIEVEALVGARGEGRVEVTETFLGAGAIEWRNDLEGIPAAVLSQRFEEGYVARLIPAGRLMSLDISGQDSAEGPLVLRYVVESPALGRQQGDQVFLNAFFPTILGPRFARGTSRRTPQLVGPAMDISVNINLRLAHGGTPPTRAPVNLEGPGGARFESEAEVSSGMVKIRRHLQVPLMRVTPEDYSSFAAFCRAVDEAEARAIPLN